MIPIVTPAEMTAIDAAAAASMSELIDRAGRAVAAATIELLGGTYGRRVVVIAGPGNNGADGRTAATHLNRQGVKVAVVEAGVATTVSPCDVVIDAAYGTGLSRPYRWPTLPEGASVLAVDIVSGVDGLTGRAEFDVPTAIRTVTFAALKPGLLLGRGATAHPAVTVADIGLDVSVASAWQVEASDVARWLPRLRPDRHKWQAAVWAVAGSPGMTGAPALCAEAALRAGAGYVRLSPRGDATIGSPIEAVHTALPAGDDWPADAPRFGSIVFGPGLGIGADVQVLLRAVLQTGRPLVIDGDGLTALAAMDPGGTGVLGTATVLTPHDGEYERLMGQPPDADRLAAARSAAQRYGCTVLLKGPATVVATANGNVRVVTGAPPSLSTAGTGDVLAGIIGSYLAQGMSAFDAAAAAAFVHGRAAIEAAAFGLVAGDLPGRLPEIHRQLVAAEVTNP